VVVVVVVVEDGLKLMVAKLELVYSRLEVVVADRILEVVNSKLEEERQMVEDRIEV
jgi:hypothetical protein